MNFDTSRTLAIDVGIWNFAFAIVSRTPTADRPFTLERWENVSLPDMGGFPGARDFVSGNDIGMTLLSDITFTALARCFPARWVIHNVDFVWIESQPRVRGKAGKVAELSSTIYNYFQAITASDRLCCWKFPDVQMVGAGVKFDGGIFFDLVADEIHKRTNLGPDSQKDYQKRKQYGVALVHALLTHTHCTLHIPEGVDIGYTRASKKDDYCDSLILAAAAMRER
jgi:hypothetical protein